MNVDLLVRGIPMPHFAAADLLTQAWREIGVTTPVIMISGQATVDMAVRAARLNVLGAIAYE